jgi:hypothetical protein
MENRIILFPIFYNKFTILKTKYFSQLRLCLLHSWQIPLLETFQKLRISVNNDGSTLV